MIGQTVSHYRVVERLGGGGMGIVYRAEDTKLRRSVALKFLPPELTRDDDAKQRFVLEAQAASALDHPNIATVYEIDETADGQLFLVMAYYPGETLKQTISRGPLTLDDALDYATQIAQGLVKAHAAGILHRDIKPANVMVTSDGLAKIVDFGLAKLMDATAITRTGMILGTLAYMSPEQVTGHGADARSDLWSLGVVLYELITGQLPFQGEDQAALAHAIAHRAPAPLTTVRTGVPIELERIVTRALAKRPEDRYQTAADLLSELRRLRRESDRLVQLIPARTTWRTGALMLGPVVLIAGTVGYLALSRRGTAPSIPRLANPVQVAASTGAEQRPSWSPDGRLIAYESNQTGNDDIWVTQVGGGPPVNRTVDSLGFDARPRWSPDGQIAFWSEREGGGLFAMSALAGGARKIAPDDPTRVVAAAVWSPDGSALAYPVRDTSGQWLESRTLRDGTTQRLILPGRTGTNRLQLTWSPDGRFLAYVEARNLSAQVTRIWILRWSDATGVPITDGRMNEWSPSWSPDSRTLYFVSNRGGTKDLWQQRILQEGASNGPPEQITTGLEVLQAAVSPDGRRVAYTKGRPVANAWRVPILDDRAATWSDAQQLTFDHAYVEHLDVSRDGQRLVVSSDRSGNPDLWILPAHGGELQPFTTDPTPDWTPAWSPDGHEIAFYAYRSGYREIWIQPIGGGAAHQVTRREADSTWPRWSPDGKMVVFDSTSSSSADIWVVPARGGEPQLILRESSFSEIPDWSPDGRWLLFTSRRSDDESRIWRVSAKGGSPEPVTKGEGWLARWSPDGHWICFLSSRGPNQVWVVSPDGHGKSERALTNLVGRRGGMGSSLATDGRYLYFPWDEDLASDIWVMDVVPAGQ